MLHILSFTLSFSHHAKADLMGKLIPIDLNVLRELDPKPNPLVAWGSAAIFMGLLKGSPGSRVTFEGLENLPQRPVIIAMNHTQFYDFLPLRAPLLFRGRRFSSWVKARAFREERVKRFLLSTGNIPLCSRGYILASDFYSLFTRRPTEDEYRAMRRHLDHGELLPEGDVFSRLEHTPRAILGRPFSPPEESWRGAMRETYYELMTAAIDHARRCVERGDHIHIYPQGTIAARLISGKIGIIQTAIALDLPILPVGVSGCREAFYKGTPMVRPNSHMIVRFGATPYSVPREEFPPNFRPFHPDDEPLYRDRLQRHVDIIMEQLNLLLEPDYQWGPDRQSEDAKQGVDRFF